MIIRISNLFVLILYDKKVEVLIIDKIYIVYSNLVLTKRHSISTLKRLSGTKQIKEYTTVKLYLN